MAPSELIPGLPDAAAGSSTGVGFAVAGTLPNYRLSKFQALVPPWVEREMLADYLLDVAGAWRWIAGVDDAGQLGRVPAGLREPTAPELAPRSDEPEAAELFAEGRTARDRIKLALNYALMILLALFFLAPILYLLIGSLKERHIARLTLDGDKVVGEERLLTEFGERIRDVVVGPDGAVWAVTDEEDGKVLRITPKG